MPRDRRPPRAPMRPGSPGQLKLAARRHDTVAGHDHHGSGDIGLADPGGRGELADDPDGRDCGGQGGPPQLGAGPAACCRVVDVAQQRRAENLGADQMHDRVPPQGGGHRRRRQRGQLLGRRPADITRRGAQHQARHQRGVPPVQQLGNYAAHGIPHGGEPADPQDTCQRGDIVRAILQPEPRAGADPVAMATQIRGDDPEVTPERREDLRPVQLRRERHPVDQHERLRAARARALPHPRRPAAGQLHQAGTRYRCFRGHPAFLLFAARRLRSRPGRPTAARRRGQPASGVRIAGGDLAGHRGGYGRAPTGLTGGPRSRPARRGNSQRDNRGHRDRGHQCERTAACWREPGTALPGAAGGARLMAGSRGARRVRRHAARPGRLSTACTLAPAWRRMLRWFPPTLRRCPVPRQVRRLDRRRGRPPGSCPGPGPRQPGRVVPTEPRCGNWTAPAYGQYGASRNRAAAGTSPRFRSRHRRISGWRPARRCGQARPGDKCGGRTDWWCADGPPAGTGPRRVLRKAPDGLAGSRPRDPGCRRWRPGRHR